MNNAFHTLEGTLDQVWQVLGRGVADRKSPARTPAFATVSKVGHPEVRTVVLRSASREHGVLEIHTDVRSNKVKDLEINSIATFCFWIPKADLQMRLKVVPMVASGTEVEAIWNRIPNSARRVYGGSPSPGQLLANPGEYLASPDPADFAVLRCEIQEIETLQLGADMHRRARFRREDNWQGVWIAP